MRIEIDEIGNRTRVFADDGRDITADLRLTRIECSVAVDEPATARLICTAPIIRVVASDRHVAGIDLFSWRRSTLAR